MASQTDVCDVCGKSFKGVHGVTMHKTRIHGRRKWNNKSVAKKKATPKVRDQRVSTLVMTELLNEGSRILLVDEAGDWWVAKKLDI